LLLTIVLGNRESWRGVILFETNHSYTFSSPVVSFLVFAAGCEPAKTHAWKWNRRFKVIQNHWFW